MLTVASYITFLWLSYIVLTENKIIIGFDWDNICKDLEWWLVLRVVPDTYQALYELNKYIWVIPNIFLYIY